MSEHSAPGGKDPAILLQQFNALLAPTLPLPPPPERFIGAQQFIEGTRRGAYDIWGSLPLRRLDQTSLALDSLQDQELAAMTADVRSDPSLLAALRGPNDQEPTQQAMAILDTLLAPTLWGLAEVPRQVALVRLGYNQNLVCTQRFGRDWQTAHQNGELASWLTPALVRTMERDLEGHNQSIFYAGDFITQTPENRESIARLMAQEVAELAALVCQYAPAYAQDLPRLHADNTAAGLPALFGSSASQLREIIEANPTISARLLVETFLRSGSHMELLRYVSQQKKTGTAVREAYERFVSARDGLLRNSFITPAVLGLTIGEAVDLPTTGTIGQAEETVAMHLELILHDMGLTAIAANVDQQSPARPPMLMSRWRNALQIPMHSMTAPPGKLQFNGSVQDIKLERLPLDNAYQEHKIDLDTITDRRRFAVSALFRARGRRTVRQTVEVLMYIRESEKQKTGIVSMKSDKVQNQQALLALLRGAAVPDNTE